MCYIAVVLTLLVFAIVIKSAGITPCVKENEAPKVKEVEEKDTRGTPKAKMSQ